MCRVCGVLRQFVIMCRCCSEGIATHYRLHGPGIETRCGGRARFPHPSRSGSLPGVNRPLRSVPTYLHLARCLRKSTATHLVLLYAFLASYNANSILLFNSKLSHTHIRLDSTRLDSTHLTRPVCLQNFTFGQFSTKFRCTELQV